MKSMPKLLECLDQEQRKAMMLLNLYFARSLKENGSAFYLPYKTALRILRIFGPFSFDEERFLDFLLRDEFTIDGNDDDFIFPKDVSEWLLEELDK